MANKGPIIAVGAITGVLFFWRKKKRKKAKGDDGSEVAADEVKAEA
jgi:hypothetical protein